MSEKSRHGTPTLVRPPNHPVPQLQKPFEESMLESINDQADQDVPLDAMTRRTILLDSPTYQRVIAGRWKQKSGEKYHPLWKLVAQMSFGMHLLAENMAVSEEEVMRILQSHVDDIDGFLERTTEDFDSAQSDIHERTRCLKLPLAHGDVFDHMLEDRAFRASILEGNEKIDHVISRTKRSAKDALNDVQKGFDATNVLEKYLSKLNSTWKRRSSEHEAVLVAMLGNVEGWRRAFLELHLQGNKLAGSLKKLSEVVAEMQDRAAAVSRNIVAKAQKTKHISSQQGGRGTSRTTSINDQKPLPVEPGRRHPTKNASRSTHVAGSTSRPDTGHRSGRPIASHAPSSYHRSLHSSASKKDPGAEPSGQSLSLEAKALEESRASQNTQHLPKIGGLLIQSAGDAPIELPADVPEDLLRQAPVSTMNRLSLTLGLKAKDNGDHRISSIYFPRALGDLLKSPEMSDLLSTPQSNNIKGTQIRAVASPVVISAKQTDYFTSHEKSPSIGVATPSTSSRRRTNSTKTSTVNSKSSGRSFMVGSAAGTRRSSGPNVAFTSHRSVMAMASPPAELPASGREEQSSSKSRKTSRPSSLGEPGPELTDGATTRSASVSDPMMLVDTSIITISHDPAPFAEEKPEAAEEQQVPESPEDVDERQGHDTAVADVARIPKSERGTAIETDYPKTEVANAKEDDLGQLVSPNEDAADPQIQYVAELEAAVPAPLRPVRKDHGPAELEAPQQTFNLPPRPTAEPKSAEEVVHRAKTQQPEDFFKLPTEVTIKPGLKPMDFSDSSGEEPIRPLRLKLAKKDGKLVPVQINGSRGSNESGGSESKSRIDVVADIIETMSHTPPGSPVHERSLSSTSSNSAQRWSRRSSRLGPPEQAPAPPGPSGRPMVSPDFAAAGEFQGERKHKTRSSNASKSSWKAFFLHGASKSMQRPDLPAAPLAGQSSLRPSSSEKDMMTTSGKDVLWFKGENDKSVNVSSA
ncbi:hypothetical protein EDD37DRAFT_650750 [Exophiala viscosa]|uniref:uncharacterized protein n=1 Tax=Exophiala viscosa TaxID=2486360 RepID=UPI002196933E|nr:hypothetical protein EDD37DRAFT_650750 [Exophiala viscosa]